MRSDGTTFSRYEYMAANNSDDPAPPAPRKITASVKLGATAVRKDENATNSNAAVADSRSPHRSTIGPANRSKPRRVNAKAEMSSPAAPYPTPKERANNGRTGATIPKP